MHVQQPVARFGDKYVVFGMGNLASNQSPAVGLSPQTQDGAIVGVHVVRQGRRWITDRVTITATYCEPGSYTVLPVTKALADPSTPASLRARLTASLQRTKAIYASLRGHSRDAVSDLIPAAHRSRKPLNAPEGADQRYSTPVTAPGRALVDGCSWSHASSWSHPVRGPSATTSTRPSRRLLAVPTRPSSSPRDRVHQRNPTPCTVPRTHTVSRTAFAAEEAHSGGAGSGRGSIAKR